MTATVTEFEIYTLPTYDPEKTCELRRLVTGRCTRPAYVIAHLSKPCGHLNAFLLCEPCWNDVLAGNVQGLLCGRCKQPFDIKTCIISWDLL